MPFVLNKQTMQNEAGFPPIFQNWQTAPVQSGDEISFDVATAPGEPASRWSLELPAKPEEAEAALAQAETQLRATQALLDEAPDRLDAFVSRLQSGTDAHFSIESFAVEGVPGQPAEADLLPWIEYFEPGQISFDGQGITQGQAKEALDQLRQMIDGLVGQILYLAQVETRQGGALLARSLVNWKGDLDTSWGEAISPEQHDLHQRSLALALASRIAMLRVIMTTTQGAAKIAALIAAPGGALLALPAAWKYVSKILSEIEKYQTSSA